MQRRVRVGASESKIMAVKLVRELTGLGLRESLEHVEQGRAFTVEREDFELHNFVAQARQHSIVLELDPPLGGFSSSAHIEPVSERGEWSVRYRSGPNKIASIKLVRELTQLGLAEAKALVEQEQVICKDLPRARAEEIVARFRELGAVAEVVGGSSAATTTTKLPPPRTTGYSSPDDDF